LIPIAKPIVLTMVLLVAAGGDAVAADAPSPISSASPPSLFTVNDNSIGTSYVFRGTDPGAGPTPKVVMNFSHFDVWAYGTNFVSVDWLMATNAKPPPFGAPAAPCDLDPPTTPERCPGYTEVYGLIRSTLGWNQLFDTRAFSIGPLTNVEFAFGVDLNWDNTTLKSQKRSIQAGLQFDFAMPYKGSLNIGAFVYKEWQNNGFARAFPFDPIPNPSGHVDFDATWAIEANYSQPLGFLPDSVPLTYKALAAIHGPKGCGEPCSPSGPGLHRTTEYMFQQTLNLDVGKMAGPQPNHVTFWAGHRWWKNKFGIREDQPNGRFPATLESTWLLGVTLGL
jgi:nucleoside-specific outer membrane channel protein Tsx